MTRIDIEALIQNVEFPADTWEWLGLFAQAIIVTQSVGVPQDAVYVADTPYKHFMLRSVNRDLEAMTAIYLLLRSRFIHQAAAQTRLLCEGLISWRFIARNPDQLSTQFQDYAVIELHRIAEAILEAEASHAIPKPEHVEQVRLLLDESQSRFAIALPKYQFQDRKGKTRQFTNWCNADVAQQAGKCGSETERLYQVVYKQMSAYVHGSPWSLRRQLAYSVAHYDPKAVHVDIATVTRTALVIWAEWCRTCQAELGWDLSDCVSRIASELDALDARQFPIPDASDA